MKEIKFRLHDKSGAIIGYENHEKNQHGCYQIIQTSLRGDFADTETMNVRDGFFIAATYKCLFTGLKDKTGKAIYEGDLIKYSGDDYNADYMLVVWNESECRFQVDVYGHAERFNEGGGEYFDSEITKVDENIMDMSSLTEMKVIGNIHQNPELI